MSDSWTNAEVLAERLREAMPAEVQAPVDEALERAVAHALAAKAAQRARSRRLGVGACGMAAAAALLLVLWPTQSGHPRRDGVALSRASVPSTASAAGELTTPDNGSQAAPPELRAPVTLRSGASAVVQLAPASRVELRHALVRAESFGKTAAFVLQEGGMVVDANADVDAVTVTVDGVRVEARGATVAVDRSSAGCAGARVRVARGQATVRRGDDVVVLQRGGEWSECPAAAPVASSGKVAVTSSSLEEQNQALAAAVDARRAGQAEQAIAKYTYFLKRWPRGPLSEVARADRMNLLQGRDPAAARAAAREYLREHPQGAARARAEQIANEGVKP